MRSVSVIIPSYNRSATLMRAIESVFAQDYPIAEIIVVDDHSTDGTRALLESLDDRVTWFVNETNMGSQHSRNRGVAASTGEFVAFLDSDDIWRADKIRLQIEAVGARAEACVTCGYRQFGAEGDRSFVPPAEIRLETAFVHNIIGPTSNILVSRSIIDAVGPFDAAMPSCQDWEFFVRVMERYPIIGVRDILTSQDTGSGSRISNNRAKVVSGHQTLYRRARATREYRSMSLPRRLAVRARQELALMRRSAST